MTDRVTEALTTALKQALDDPAAERRLYKSGKLDGLFPGRGGLATQAAARALDEGLLEPSHTETKGKTVIEWVRLTPRGVQFLHERESPVHALHELRDALRANHQAIPLWLADMRSALHALDERLTTDAERWQRRLDTLARRVEEALRRLEPAVPPPEVAEPFPWVAEALAYLDHRRGGGASSDCPLPELFRTVARQHPGLSVGAFHDGLRRLHDRRALRLLPANGAGELAQPEYALLDNGLLLYYAAR